MRFRLYKHAYALAVFDEDIGVCQFAPCTRVCEGCQRSVRYNWLNVLMTAREGIEKTIMVVSPTNNFTVSAQLYDLTAGL